MLHSDGHEQSLHISQLSFWQKDINRRIQQRQLKYFGHIALYGHLRGKRRQGRQKKRWIDTIKEDCIEMHMKFYDATQTTQAREVWRKSVEELLTRVDSTSPRH